MAPVMVPFNTNSTPPDFNLTYPDSGISCSWAENGPNWTDAKETLQYGLDAHVYFFGACFSIVLLYAIVLLIFAVRRHQSRGRLAISLHLILAFSSSMRAISLLVDPYGSRMLLPCPFNVIVWSFGWPGIISAYSIFFLTVLESTQLSVGPPRFQRTWTMATIIAFSLVYVLVSDLLASYPIPSGIISILLCELMFMAWGMALTAGFVYVWWRLRKNLSASLPRNEKERRRVSVHGSVSAIMESEARRLKRLIAIIFISALDCLMLTITHVVPVVGMFIPEVVDFVSRPWQWFAYQTGQRILEVTICVLIAVAMMKSPSSPGDITSRSVSGKQISTSKPAPGNGGPNGNVPFADEAK